MLDMGAAMGPLAHILSAGASPQTDQLVRALWLVASLTLVVDASAVFYQPAMGPVFGGRKLAYYGTLVGILAVVGLEMATAYWLPRGGTQLAAFAKALLRFAVLLLLLVVALGGFAMTIKL